MVCRNAPTRRVRTALDMADPDKISKLRITAKTQGSSTGRRKWKVLFLLLLLAASAWGLAEGYRRGMFTPAVTVRVTSIGWVYPSQVVAEFNASGYVVAQGRAAVASKGTGRLEYLGVREGVRVKEGDVLARLESGDIKAEKAQAEAQLAGARHDLVRAETDLRTAERNYNRYKNLRDQQVVAQNDFDNVSDRHQSARAAVESSKAAVRALEAAVKKASVLIEYTIIRAPFDGVILTKDADVGEVVAPFGSAVSAKAAVVTMADLSSLMVQADVAESSLSRVRVDQPCEIQLDSLPDVRFPGKVNMIVPTADRARGTVQAKVAFDALDPRILPEMSAKVAFLSRPLKDDERRPFLGVHRDAFAKRDGAPGYFAVRDDRAVWVPVTAEEPYGDYVVLHPPAKAGETIVLQPAPGLKSGDSVKAAD